MIIAAQPPALKTHPKGVQQAVLCAQAMGLQYALMTVNRPEHTVRILQDGHNVSYWPQGNDQQAMALARRFMLELDFFVGKAAFPAALAPESGEVYARYSDTSIRCV